MTTTPAAWTYRENPARLTEGDVVTDPRTGRRLTLVAPAPSTRPGVRMWWAQGASGGLRAFGVRDEVGVLVHNRPPLSA